MHFNKQPSYGRYNRGNRKPSNSPPIDFTVNDIVFEKKRLEKVEVDWKTNDICFHSKSGSSSPAASSAFKSSSRNSRSRGGGYMHGNDMYSYAQQENMYSSGSLVTTVDKMYSIPYMETMYGAAEQPSMFTSGLDMQTFYSSSPMQGHLGDGYSSSPIQANHSEQYSNSPAYGVDYLYGSPTLYTEMQYSNSPTFTNMYGSPDLYVNTETATYNVARNLEKFLASPNTSSVDREVEQFVGEDQGEQLTGVEQVPGSLDSSKEEFNELESDEELNLLVDNIITELVV